MGIVSSLVDGLGVFLIIALLFLPNVWFAVYFIWEAVRWKETERQSYFLRELSTSSQPVAIPLYRSGPLVVQDQSSTHEKEAA